MVMVIITNMYVFVNHPVKDGNFLLTIEAFQCEGKFCVIVFSEGLSFFPQISLAQ
jgi:hypothetical protein